MSDDKSQLKSEVREAWHAAPESQKQYATFAELVEAMKAVVLRSVPSVSKEKK